MFCRQKDSEWHAYVQGGKQRVKEWHLYVLLCADGTYYTGITTDLKRRLDEHNKTRRGAKYTRTRRPTQMVHTEGPFLSRSLSQKAEYKFKSLTRKQKEKVINEQLRPEAPEDR